MMPERWRCLGGGSHVMGVDDAQHLLVGEDGEGRGVEAKGSTTGQGVAMMTDLGGMAHTYSSSYGRWCQPWR